MALATTMECIVLNPLSSTGFLLRDVIPGTDVLVDMQSSTTPLTECLREHGSSAERISDVFISHFHADHFYPTDALELVSAGARIHMGHTNWDAMFAYWANSSHHAERLEYCRQLERSGSLNLLAPSGTSSIESVPVAWATYPHGNGDVYTDNLAYRIGDHLVSGDTTINALFDMDVPGSAQLLDLAYGELVRTLCINVAQVSRHEIHARTDLPERRIRNYLENHGILEDLIAVIRADRFAKFFESIRTIIPIHIRRPDALESAALIATGLREAAASIGYTFTVDFGNEGS